MKELNAKVTNIENKVPETTSLFTKFSFNTKFAQIENKLSDVPNFVNKKISSHKIRLSRPYHFKFFKGCLPQISLGPFLNNLSQILINFSSNALFTNKYNIYKKSVLGMSTKVLNDVNIKPVLSSRPEKSRDTTISRTEK